MKKNRVKRENQYAYAKLSLLFNSKLKFIVRDTEMLIKYNITEFTTADLPGMSQMLKDTILDDEMVQKQKDVTSEKNVLLNQLIKNLTFIKTAFQNSFAKREIRSLVPTIFKLSSQTDWELVHTANAALRIGATYQPQLQTWGITPIFLSETAVLLKTFEETLYEIPTQKSERSQTTFARQELANKAYRTLRAMCKVGRMIWSLESDNSKYNDYLLPSAKQLRSTAEIEENTNIRSTEIVENIALPKNNEETVSDEKYDLRV